jgi:hypothetical protein
MVIGTPHVVGLRRVVKGASFGPGPAAVGMMASVKYLAPASMWRGVSCVLCSEFSATGTIKGHCRQGYAGWRALYC